MSARKVILIALIIMLLGFASEAIAFVNRDTMEVSAIFALLAIIFMGASQGLMMSIFGALGDNKEDTDSK